MQIGDIVTLRASAVNDGNEWNSPRLIGRRGEIISKLGDNSLYVHFREAGCAWWYTEYELEHYDTFAEWVKETRRRAGINET